MNWVNKFSTKVSISKGFQYSRSTKQIKRIPLDQSKRADIVTIGKEMNAYWEIEIKKRQKYSDRFK